MYNRTPSRRGTQPTPSTPSMRPTSSMGSRTQTPASTSRLRSSRYGERSTFTPVRERPASSLSFGNSRPTTPSFAVPSQPYTGSISVAIRAKPSDTFIRDPWLLTNESIQHNDVGEFKFDHVFHPSSTNSEVYEKVVKNLIETLMEGYNATVFAYGMTGSGKTYSMTGTRNEPGVIPLSISEIFKKIKASDKSIFKYDLKVSYLEIYNERIYDLLNVDQLKHAATATSELKIRDVPNYGVKVIGLMEEAAKNEKDVIDLINRGNLNRRTGETDFNARSSRSHAIVLVRVATTNTVTGMETFATLSLCDLAGSERATAQSERRKEGSFINKSLLALGSVIVKLSSSSTSAGHINYRDSKLTRILQPALSGNSVVSILCTIHTSNTALAETINTVRFAARAKNITLNVRKQENDITSEKDRMIEKMRQQIEMQLDEIETLKNAKTISLESLESSAGSSAVSETVMEQITQLTAENRILVERVEHLSRLTDQRNAEKLVLKNEIMNDIITKSADGQDQTDQVMVKVETLFKKTFAEVDEYKSYINHLEHQFKKAIAQGGTPSSSSSTPPISQENYPPTSSSGNHSDMDHILRDQEEDILQLKNELKSKDKIIKALQSAKRVRESLVHTISSNESRRESIRHDHLRPLNIDLNAKNKFNE